MDQGSESNVTLEKKGNPPLTRTLGGARKWEACVWSLLEDGFRMYLDEVKLERSRTKREGKRGRR